MIQAFAFDLDGTLYSKDSNLYRAMSLSIANWFKSQLNISGDFENFYRKMKCDYPSLLEAIQAFDLSIASFHREVFDHMQQHHYQLEESGISHTFSGLAGRKFLVTLSSPGHAAKVLQALNVVQHFSGFFHPGINWNTNNKIDAYEAIRGYYRWSPEEICVVGDNYEVDLEAAQKVGYRCVLVSSTEHMRVPTIGNFQQLPEMLCSRHFNEGRQQ